jgi:UDP-glucose:(heptosyl)LPS alpha-1,3-glucosyltransferase
LHFAFLIFKVFQYGGVQRDMLRIANDLANKGHTVSIFTGEWRGDMPTHASIKHQVLPTNGWLNHQRHANLVKAMLAEIENGQFDLIVGFNRMAKLDAYFAADPCYAARAAQRSWWHKLTPRYRFFAESERAVFGTQVNTHILLLTARDQALFQQYYQTPNARFHLIAPNIPNAQFAGLNAAECAIYVRQTFKLPTNANVILTVGSAYLRKGVDRAMLGLASLPAHLRDTTWLISIGELESASTFLQDAKKLGVAKHCIEAGGRSDVAKLMLGATVLAHPARSELAGIVLIEALVAQLPVIVTDVCGYASHIAQANTGIVLPEPYSQAAFNAALLQILQQDNAAIKTNARNYITTLKANNKPEPESNILIELAKNKATQK